MNRFFRSALFPLIVIVALVYVASQVMLRNNNDQEKVTYSQLQGQIKDGEVQEVLFTPNRQQITATMVSGKKEKVNYPSDVSALQVEGGAGMASPGMAAYCAWSDANPVCRAVSSTTTSVAGAGN